MKKQYMLAIVLAISIMSARAQSSYTTIQYNDKMQPALVLELPNNTEDAEGTILQKLKQTGYDPETQGHLFWKKNKLDGFYVFNNVSLPSLSDLKLDMYFKVVQKNKREKNSSTLYLLVSKGNENFASPDNDTMLWNSSVIFLNSFVEKTTAYSLEQDISTQENNIKEQQDKYIKLQNDEKDLADKIRKYQEDLLKNQTAQKSQQQQIENQKKILEALKLKRKG
ncbi:MAG TPA: hypothetical protein PLP23_00185 [Panacibacter sp.]|nr:hypothetical protein [Panacibacter sp.]